MTNKYPATRNLRDIGQVVPFIEKMDAARLSSSCCVGVEANLETNKDISGFMHRLSKRTTAKNPK